MSQFWIKTPTLISKCMEEYPLVVICVSKKEIKYDCFVMKKNIICDV